MKKKKLKKRMIEAAVLIVIFLIAVKVFGYFTNKGNDNMTADMGAATCPQVSFSYDGYTINTVPGYSEEMSISSLRDTITPVSDGKLEINIRQYDSAIISAQCNIYSLDGKDRILETKVEDPGRVVTVNFSDTSIIEEEKVLQVILNLEEDKEVYYYTRIVDERGMNAAECLDYIKNFHENALNKVEDAGVGKAIEPNEEGNNTTLQHVTIHSDYDHVTWGELEPKVEGGETWLIKELNGTTCSVQLLYQVRCKGEENEEDLYKVKEFFRVRYKTDSKVGLLLDYDRTMDQVFDPSKKVLNEKGILLGIADRDTPYMVNKDGTQVAFVQADELWHYNRDTDEISRVFSFVSAESTDERNLTAQHKIEPLEMDKSGNLTFAVYGYMNRGEHEGEVGIAIYYYNIEQSSVEEKVFISTRKSYGHTIHELGKMVYYSAERNMLYAIIDGVFYEIDVEKNRTNELVTGLKDGQYVVSDDRKLIAYQTEEDPKSATEVQIMNLSTGNNRTVTCGEGESIQPLGFMQTDFVYGLSRISDAGESVTGETIIPMYKIEIQSNKEKIIKTYEVKGIYILGASFEGNMITLERATKNGDTYNSVLEDHITNNEEKTESNIYLESYSTSLKQTQMRIVYSDGIEDSEPKVLKPKQTLREQPTTFSFDESAEEEQYLVYGYGELQGIYEKAADAIKQADLYSGVVVSNRQEYVWERGNRNLQHYITEKDDVLETMITQLKEGTVPVEVVKQAGDGNSLDLTGCTVEELMYIIDQERPVIAMCSDKNAIILVGYTESTMTYIDVKSGERKTVSTEEIESMTKKSGHTYIA
ncbi:MAG: hypothetical protein ACI4D9_08365 [Lachnospiraceae bacterium]